jgi:hypothetical protein
MILIFLGFLCFDYVKSGSIQTRKTPMEEEQEQAWVLFILLGIINTK